METPKMMDGVPLIEYKPATTTVVVVDVDSVVGSSFNPW
jgi:hypothetical protein